MGAENTQKSALHQKWPQKKPTPKKDPPQTKWHNLGCAIKAFLILTLDTEPITGARKSLLTPNGKSIVLRR